MAKKDKQMIKIVYFDEGSVTDFIYVLNGGKNTVLTITPLYRKAL